MHKPVLSNCLMVKHLYVDDFSSPQSSLQWPLETLEMNSREKGERGRGDKVIVG